jgi:hypothetical protein
VSATSFEVILRCSLTRYEGHVTRDDIDTISLRICCEDNLEALSLSVQIYFSNVLMRFPLNLHIAEVKSAQSPNCLRTQT